METASPFPPSAYSSVQEDERSQLGRCPLVPGGERSGSAFGGLQELQSRDVLTTLSLASADQQPGYI